MKKTKKLMKMKSSVVGGHYRTVGLNAILNLEIFLEESDLCRSKRPTRGRHGSVVVLHQLTETRPSISSILGPFFDSHKKKTQQKTRQHGRSPTLDREKVKETR